MGLWGRGGEGEGGGGVGGRGGGGVRQYTGKSVVGVLGESGDGREENLAGRRNGAKRGLKRPISSGNSVRNGPCPDPTVPGFDMDPPAVSSSMNGDDDVDDDRRDKDRRWLPAKEAVSSPDRLATSTLQITRAGSGVELPPFYLHLEDLWTPAILNDSPESLDFGLPGTCIKRDEFVGLRYVCAVNNSNSGNNEDVANRGTGKLYVPRESERELKANSSSIKSVSDLFGALISPLTQSPRLQALLAQGASGRGEGSTHSPPPPLWLKDGSPTRWKDSLTANGRRENGVPSPPPLQLKDSVMAWEELPRSGLRLGGKCEGEVVALTDGPDGAGRHVSRCFPSALLPPVSAAEEDAAAAGLHVSGLATTPKSAYEAQNSCLQAVMAARGEGLRVEVAVGEPTAAAATCRVIPDWVPDDTRESARDFALDSPPSFVTLQERREGACCLFSPQCQNQEVESDMVFEEVSLLDSDEIPDIATGPRNANHGEDRASRDSADEFAGFQPAPHAQAAPPPPADERRRQGHRGEEEKGEERGSRDWSERAFGFCDEAGPAKREGGLGKKAQGTARNMSRSTAKEEGEKEGEGEGEWEDSYEEEEREENERERRNVDTAGSLVMDELAELNIEEESSCSQTEKQRWIKKSMSRRPQDKDKQSTHIWEVLWKDSSVAGGPLNKLKFETTNPGYQVVRERLQSWSSAAISSAAMSSAAKAAMVASGKLQGMVTQQRSPEEGETRTNKRDWLRKIRPKIFNGGWKGMAESAKRRLRHHPRDVTSFNGRDASAGLQHGGEVPDSCGHRSEAMAVGEGEEVAGGGEDDSDEEEEEASTIQWGSVMVEGRFLPKREGESLILKDSHFKAVILCGLDGDMWARQ
ncbi:hypothetical protein CBR_g49715 [Chara braunii]|uniref:Uncharacterized protein n=1 Tax=Chara braunii TaxID=69332 RepID=A0A388M5L1_CHABU|nr:hypothetical protein CBR_g49715 [Chara braunii]|eukprot:GBG89867.1 hypothetical protein CBR_g49715 [Chara braunii]